MPLYRQTAFFRDDDGHGWSETHDYSSGTDTDIDIAARAEQFNQLIRTRRVPLLARDAFYLGCRVSKYQPGAFAKTQSFPIFLDLPDKGTQNVSTARTEMDAALLAVKVTMATINGVNRSDIYLRGVWEQVITAGQLDFSGATGSAFQTLLKDYQDALIQAGYGWIGKASNSSAGTVSGYTSLPDGRIKFTLGSIIGLPLPAVGQQATFYFARLNNSNSVLNRPIVCKMTAAFECESVTPNAAGPFVSAGTYYLRVPAFFGYALVAYRKLSARKTGRPTGVGRGRLPARRVF